MTLPTNRAPGDIVQSSDINALAEQVNANETAIATKAASGHTHAASEITGFPAAVSGALADLRGVPSGIAGLDEAGKVPITQVPVGTTSSTVAAGDHVHPTLSVAGGGTGRTTGTVANGVVATGTTATGPQQTISPGATGGVLKSTGPTSLPSFQALTKADVGLANVNNTSDADKPISTAQQTALNAKAAAVHTHAQDDVTGLPTALSDRLAWRGPFATSTAYKVNDIVTVGDNLLRARTNHTSGTLTPTGDVADTQWERIGTRNASGHQHAIADVTGLQSALNARDTTEIHIMYGSVVPGQWPPNPVGVGAHQVVVYWSAWDLGAPPPSPGNFRAAWWAHPQFEFGV